ncbi:MAG: tetratricopeptide repeat protein [Calditrichaeota bacterium]|nr:tetratricopeptide repeat protein [Calditrichota bacterium]
MKNPRLILILFLSGFFLTLFEACYAPKTYSGREPESAYRYYEKALRLKIEGDLDKALRQISQAIALNSRIALFYVLKAQIFDSLKQADSAIFYYQASLKLRSHAPEVLARLGELHIRAGNFTSGIRYLDKAYQEDPQKTALLLQIAGIYSRMKQMRRVNDVLDEYRVQTELKKRPLSPEYFILMGDVFFLNKDYFKAAAFYEQSSCEKCFSPEQAARAFDAFLKSQKLDSYFKLLSGLDKKRFSEAEFYYYRGLYYRAIGNYSEAKDQLLLALGKGMNNPDLFYYLAKIYQKENDKAMVRQMYQKLKAVDPQNPRLNEIETLLR